MKIPYLGTKISPAVTYNIVNSYVYILRFEQVAVSYCWSRCWRCCSCQLELKSDSYKSWKTDMCEFSSSQLWKDLKKEINTAFIRVKVKMQVILVVCMTGNSLSHMTVKSYHELIKEPCTLIDTSFFKTRTPPTGALYAQRKCSHPIRKTRIFISIYLKIST